MKLIDPKHDYASYVHFGSHPKDTSTSKAVGGIGGGKRGYGKKGKKSMHKMGNPNSRVY